MARNKLQDLRDHLFEAIENIRDAEGEAEIELAMKKGANIAEISKQIIETGKLEYMYLKQMGNIEDSQFVPFKQLPETPAK